MNRTGYDQRRGEKNPRRKGRPAPLVLILCGLGGWLAAMTEVGFLSHLPLYGTTIPLVTAVALLIGWCYGPETGALAALVGGFFLDALTGAGISLSPLLIAAAAVAVALVGEHLFDRTLLFLAASLPVFLLFGALSAIAKGAWLPLLALPLGGLLATFLICLPRTLQKWARRLR